MAVGLDGTVYVADSDNCRVQRFTGDGEYLSAWSTDRGDLGCGARDIATDAVGNVYTVGSQVQTYDSDGNTIVQWSLPLSCQALAVDGLRGYVYVAVLNVVYKYSVDGSLLDMWTAGDGGSFPETNDGIGVGPSGDVYVMGARSDLLRVFTSDGGFVRSWSVPGGWGVAVDAQEHVFVTAGTVSDHRVIKFNMHGDILTQWGSTGSGDGMFSSPRGIAFDEGGSIFVCDRGNFRIQKFGYLPTPTTRSSWGALKSRYRGDGSDGPR